MSVYFQHLVFLRPFHAGVFQRGAIRTAGKKKEKKNKIQNLTSTLLTSRDNTKKYNTSNMKTSSRPWFKQWYWLENISWTFKIFLAEKDTNYKTYKLEKWK